MSACLCDVLGIPLDDCFGNATTGSSTGVRIPGWKVTPTEAEEAPGIVVAEKSSVEATSRQRWRCAVSEHMSGLFECHAELREAMLTPEGGGSDIRVGSMRCVWHQWPAVVTKSMQQASRSIQ